MSQMIGPMLRLFKDGATSYQPEMEGLEAETGDPQVSLENLRRIVAAGPVIWKILVRPTGVLVLFDGGEQFYAPGLRVGTDGPATKALAWIASEAGFGTYERLLRFYRHLPQDWSEELPDTIPDTSMSRRFEEGILNYQPEGEGLARETGDPQVSLENLRRLMVGHRVRDMLVKPTGVLVRFKGGEEFYATGLRVATDGPATEALARIAAEAGFGPFDDLLSFYQHLPADWDDPLPDLNPEMLPPSIRARLGI